MVGRVATGDTFLAHRTLFEQIVDAGGDALFPVKENQPSILTELSVALPPSGRAHL